MIATQSDLVYTEEPHGYLWKGEPKPYVSGILADLGLKPDFSRVDPGILRHKTEIGKGAHLAIKYHNKGTLDIESVDPEIKPYFQAYLSFLQISKAEIISFETPQYSELHDFACTPDLVMKLNDRIVLIDAKTTAVIDPSVEYQLWFQEIAWNENNKNTPAEARFTLHLRKNAEYRLKDWSLRSAYNATNLLFTWREKRKRGGCHV